MRADGEPIKSTERNVRPDGKSDTPLLNLTPDAREIVGIFVGSTAEIEFYDDHIEVYPIDD